jgi:hypothetical protein
VIAKIHQAKRDKREAVLVTQWHDLLTGIAAATRLNEVTGK